MSSRVDEIYSRQVKGFTDSEKLRLVELISSDLAHRTDHRDPSAAQQAREAFHRHAGAVSLGHSTGPDNESIDADLATESSRRASPPV